MNQPSFHCAKAKSDSSAIAYAVFGATADQEASLRSQMQIMRPEVLPLRVFFLPHWKYIDTARVFRLHVPTGMSSVMFTHLPSRTVFIDNDRYLGADWLRYWVAHELGHLTMCSGNELVAEKAAHQFRNRFKNASKQEAHSEIQSRILEPIRERMALLQVKSGQTIRNERSASGRAFQ